MYIIDVLSLNIVGEEETTDCDFINLAGLLTPACAKANGNVASRAKLIEYNFRLEIRIIWIPYLMKTLQLRCFVPLE